MEKKKKPFYKRWWFIVIIVLGIIGAITGNKEESEKSNKSEVESKVVLSSDDGVKDEYTIDGTMDVEFNDDKVVITVKSNAEDGSIFECFLIDGNLNSVSDFITIENGIAQKEFEIPEEWEVGYLAGSAMMRFNLDEHPQPDHIKKIYGEKGEKLVGELAVENHLGGKNINIESKAIAYPDEDTVREHLNELFYEAMTELIELGDGLIVDIKPYMSGEGWRMAKVIVSDAWYYSAEHEKERFAEQVGQAVQNIIINTKQVKDGSSVSVYFYDVYDKELASPKILGGYKIKR